MTSRTRSPLTWLQRVGLPALLIAAAGLWAYSPAWHGGWQWDDRRDVLENVALRTPAGLARIWFHPAGLADYYPLKFTVQWVQWHLWGPNPTGYHLTNLGLHLLAAFLFWRVLRQLGLRWGWLGALAFAIHPTGVESVAWIAELKNTLSLPLLLLSLSAFLQHQERRDGGDYFRSLLWFACSLLAKSAAVMFPVFLLAAQWYRRGRITRRDVIAVAPFCALSLAAGLLALRFQALAIGTEHIANGGPAAHLALSASTAAFYLGRCLWPFGPMPIFPFWAIDPPDILQLLAWPAAAALAAWAWSARARWGAAVLLAGAWFLLLLLPFLGLVTISYMNFTWVMDHVAYAALLAPIGLGVAAWEAFLRTAPRWQARVTGAGLAALLVAFLGATHRYAAAYRDELTLWSEAVRSNPESWMAEYNLALAESRAGRAADAIASYQAALAINPDYAQAFTNWGILLATSGRVPGALLQFRHALALAPEIPEVRNDLGLALSHVGRYDEAIEQLRAAVRLSPGYAEARCNLGSALLRAGRGPEAIAEYQAALALTPDAPTLLYNLGAALQTLHRTNEAIASYERAIYLQPDLAAAHYDLAICLANAGRRSEARAHYAEAKRLDPSVPTVDFNR